jgi:hypothetical protein
MNATVAVALITSLSTLMAGVIASITSLIVGHRQNEREKERSQPERTAQQGDQQKQIRRDAYLQLLNKFDEVDGLISKAWEDYPPEKDDNPPREGTMAAREGTESLPNAMNIVKLEGPEPVIDAGEEAEKAFHEELYYILQIGVSNIGKKERLFLLAKGNYGEHYGKRLTVKKKLVDAARRGLKES